MKHLLDVNVLLAAIWQRHPDFAKADAWLPGRKVATCALSELGFLRISTNKRGAWMLLAGSSLAAPVAVLSGIGRGVGSQTSQFGKSHFPP